MRPDGRYIGDSGVREPYGGLGWETFDVTDNIDIDGDLFGRLLDMDYDDALDQDKALMATTSSPSTFAMPWAPTPELSATPLSNALVSTGQERDRYSGENNGTSGTSWHQALEEASSPSSGSVGLESPKESLKRFYRTFEQGCPSPLAQTRKPYGSPQPPPASHAFSAGNALVPESQTPQDQSGARQLGISKKRKDPEPKTEGTGLDGGKSDLDSMAYIGGYLSNTHRPHQPAKFMKFGRDQTRENVYRNRAELDASSMGAERSGRVPMLSCERQLRSNPSASSIAEQVSNRLTPSKPLRSVALTPSPRFTACRIPRSPLLGRPGHTIPFRSVAAAAAEAKAAPSTTLPSRFSSFPPLGGRDPFPAWNVKVSTTDENAAGESSFIHDMEKLLFTWDPSEVPLQQQNQNQKLKRANVRRNRNGLYRPASVNPGQLGRQHEGQQLLHQQQQQRQNQKLKQTQQMYQQQQRVHEQQLQQQKPFVGTIPLSVCRSPNVVATNMGLSPGGSTTIQTNEFFCGNPVNVGIAARRNRNGLYRPASVNPDQLGRQHEGQQLLHQEQNQKLKLKRTQQMYQQHQRVHEQQLQQQNQKLKRTNGGFCGPHGNQVYLGRSPLKGRPGHTLPCPSAVAAAAAAKASSTGGRGMPSTSEARGYSQPVHPFETGSPSISPMLGGVADATPSWQRPSFLPLGGQDPYLAAVTGGMANWDQALNVEGQPFQQWRQQRFVQQQQGHQEQQQRHVQ